jgi:hypothetical protein
MCSIVAYTSNRGAQAIRKFRHSFGVVRGAATTSQLN